MGDPLQSRLQALSVGFGRRLPERVQKIRETWGEAQEGVGSEAALSDLKQMAHALKGAGRTFGYPEISDCARRLEESLPALAQTPPPPEAAAHLDALLGDLERIAARIAEPLASSKDMRP